MTYFFICQDVLVATLDLHAIVALIFLRRSKIRVLDTEAVQEIKLKYLLSR